jgi:hypothetical protein
MKARIHKYMTNNRRIGTILIIVATLGMTLAVLASGLTVSTTTLPSSGTVISTVNIGVYSDYACTQPLTSVAWGSIAPGSSVTRIAYVKNTGNSQMTLSMSKTNWSPTAANGPISLNWNLEGTVLPANNVATASLTLSASSDTSGITSFSVNIVISGSG